MTKPPAPVVTGLARHKLLGKFDDLSTVSGAGSIGSWLSAWMKHEGAAAVQPHLGAMSGEKLQLDPEPVRHRPAFPHESTADQFFSESPFERYRALGSYVVDQMCGPLAGEGPRGGHPSPERPLSWLTPQRGPA